LNFPESISENLCCFVNDYKRSTGKGSEDVIAKDGRLVQIKATCNFKKALSSFGPKSKFDELYFIRVDTEHDKIEMHEIPVKNLEDIKVNKDKKITGFQSEEKRPRFSIIKKIIEPQNLKPYVEIDLSTKEVKKFK